MVSDLKVLSEEVTAAFEAALKAAYEQGVQDGIDRIVAAARGPMGPTPPLRNDEIASDDEGEIEEPALTGTVIRRAPRGLVPKIVDLMLRDHPGKIIAEYEQMKDRYDPRVSKKSIGNEIRRMEGKKYRRNDAGEWFPIPGDKEAAGSATNETPAASDHTSKDSTLWNRLNQ